MRRVLAVLLLALLPLPAAAAGGCLPVASAEGRVLPAGLSAAPLPAGAAVRLTFLGHASFLIESAGGISAVTDYNDDVVPPYTPDIVTMDNAHRRHFSPDPDPGIAVVLRGWRPMDGAIRQDVTLGDMRVRSIPTSVYGRRERDSDGSAIFVFEVAGLCIAHLGHLHQPITDQLLAELGTIDVALVPIDGVWTMPQEEMLAAARRIGASVLIPMHYPNQGVLRHFLALTWDNYRLWVRDSPRPVTLSRASLPRRPTVLVLRSE